MDPGTTGGAGFAVWEVSTWKDLVIPIHVDVFNSDKGDDWVYTSKRFHDKFHRMLQDYNAKRVICEFPQYFMGAVGHSATAKGSIHKLAAFVGVLMAVTWENGGTFEHVLVNDWKGQLPKHAVEQRIVRMLPTIQEELPALRTHAWDAVGIGLWAKGFLHVRS